MTFLFKQSSLSLLALCVITSLSFTAANASAAVTLYVSATGSDTADGRSAEAGVAGTGPFATLERARNELRTLGPNSAGGTVVVRGGTYNLQSTFRLEAQDSGTPQAAIVYKASAGESVVLSGSKQQSNVAYLETVIAMDNAQFVHMEGFTIEQSRKAAVTVTGGRGNTIASCIVRNAGDFGIRVKEGQEHSVIDSEIYETGLGGILLKGGDRNDLTGSKHTAIGNHIHNVGQTRTGTGGLRLEGVGNTGKQNHIHHTPGAAVTISGNDHLLEFNDIHNACEQQVDCGAVYSGRDWTFHGNVVRYNRIHDIYGNGRKTVDVSANIVEYAAGNGKDTSRGIYLDDGVSGFSIIGNLLYRIPDKLVQIGGGRHNLVENNIFITNGHAIWIDARFESFNWDVLTSRLNMVPHQSSTWQNRFPKLAKPMNNPRWPEGNKITHNIIVSDSSRPDLDAIFKYKIPPDVDIDYNVIWNNGKNVKVDYWLTESDTGVFADWPVWQETGHDKNSLLADPGFVNAAAGDFRLQASSPARSLGIKEITLSDIATSSKGLEKTNRSSPPTVGELKVK